MAHQGRCSAAILSTILLLCLHPLASVSARAAIYTVGDDSGWTFTIEDWTKGKKFKAGDILTFNYYPTFHNVAVVDLKGYKSCSASSTAKIYDSGKDRIKLSKGRNYFICSFPGHCEEGMQIAVYAH
ncbi:basic blue protein-like [Alnus glutinosa]|uniref:basic blue protein-like n=1 Tax=Alnus glutinosa TaxID=3517 RepID=UPI002D77D2AE|nr:basic blue protein-like [Alnus glutinosa]